MSKRVLFKLLFLAGCLILVLFLMNFLSSKEFKENLKIIFGNSSSQYMKWCPDHVVDYKWMDTLSLPEKVLNKWSKASAVSVKDKFCDLAIEQLDATQPPSEQKFKPLLLISSAEARTAILEWNPESKVYRVQGLVFKSSILSRELLDEGK